MEKKRLLSVAVYVVGAFAVTILTIIRMVKYDIVLFPDAMLPMELYELASVWLAWGFVPMTAASVIFYRVFHIAQGRNKMLSTLAVFLPAAVCGGFLLQWVRIIFLLWLALLLE